jgi:DnaJ-class molecular chaperone
MTDCAPASSKTARICSHCDGFPTVAVSIGGRDTHGQLHTVTVDCPACHGTGTVPTPTVQLAGGRA